MNIIEFKKKVLSGYLITKDEALEISQMPLDELAKKGAADEIRAHFCGNAFDICTIINGKSGKCSENCKYCAQSAFIRNKRETYPLLSTEGNFSRGKV